MQTLSASTRAYRSLERKIVTLELEPGSMTTEGELLSATGLGRTPVREAIQRLAWEGLIAVKPRAGLEIAPLRRKDWLKVLEARRGVEVVLAGAAARRVSDAVIDMFQQPARAMQQAVADNDVAAFLDADKALDDAVAQCADNAFAVRVAEPLQSHSRRFWFRFCRREGLVESALQHVEIILAILARDATGAERQTASLMDLLSRHAARAAGEGS